ncbi:hypothetical protein P4U24_04130 [Aeribacillus composti]|uniref:hypothetical protein n=1 Tax=Aeribacillus TaxID=1055323 RepID=UPI002E1A8E63|nr:hypothetical protein [Aeribacillus composti]
MKKIYKARRDYVKKCLTEQFGDTVKIFGDSTGLHLVAISKHRVFNQVVNEIMKKHKVKIYPVEVHAIQKGIHQNKIILGYGNLTKEEIAEGIFRLRQALN